MKSYLTIITSLLLLVSACSSSIANVETEREAKTPDLDGGINFYCGEFLDKDSGETMPATMAYVPQRKASVSIIAWKSNHIPAWDAQTRCDTVSPKFQTFYQDNRLDYLITGKNNGYDIICAVKETGQLCQPDDQLFQVKASEDPQAVLRDLTGIIEGKTSAAMYQNSGDKIYVSMDKLLDTAPIVEEVSE